MGQDGPVRSPISTGVEVSSLGLSAEAAEQVATIARGGPTPKLDTFEEFRMALAVPGAREKVAGAFAMAIRIVPPQISDRSVLVLEQGTLYRYSFTNNADTSFPKYQYTSVARMNLVTGQQEEIPGDFRPCQSNFGRALEIATDGRDVYILFEGYRTGTLGTLVARNVVGRVVVNEKLDRVIHIVYLGGRHSIPEDKGNDPKGFYISTYIYGGGALLAVQTSRPSSSGVTGISSLYSAAIDNECGAP
ncbi:MAG: hypothetical protein HYS22_03660 [Deltaproteobacteria bacterium]|nr:hypothetical protein [Deltaproteobacteria bacterium]